MAEVRVIESEPLWDRVRAACTRTVWMVIGAVLIVVVLLAVVITIVVLLAGNDGNGDSAIDYSKALIVSNDYDLYALDLESQQPRLLLKTQWGLSAFDLNGRRTIYWSEVGSSQLNSLSSKYKNLTQPGYWRLAAVAVDFNAGKVYALDESTGKLDVYDPVNGIFGTALADLRYPVDLALDPLRGIMFIVQKNHSILRSNMDGTLLRKIIRNPCVTAVSVDLQTPRLYWADVNQIESSDYWGNDRRLVIRAPNITSLGVSGNRLFWARPPDSQFPRGSLWTCTITDYACSDDSTLQLPFDYPRALKVYVGEVDNLKNPCTDSNGGCQQLCLLRSSDGALSHSCNCFLGYKLSKDQRSCELARELLLYSRGNFIRARIVDPELKTFSEAIAPIPMHSGLVLRDKPSIDFDYDFYRRALIYSDDNSIASAYLGWEAVTTRSQEVYERGWCIKDVTVDWVTGDVYYVRDNCRTDRPTSIVALKPQAENNYTVTLQNFGPSAGHPRSLVLDPKTGAYYFSVVNERGAMIYRAQDLKKVLFSKPHWSVNETSLAFDALERRLYWLATGLRVLHSVNIDQPEDEVTSLDVSAVLWPRSVVVFERYVYIANLTGVWRMDKRYGRGLVRLVPSYDEAEDEVVAGVKVYGEALQPIEPGNPCGSKNGGCEQFCFRGRKFVTSGPNRVNVTGEITMVCVCENEKEIGADGRTCVNKKVY